jgi:membrane-bound metal-dependent hydrolase YbcI (DUF457 family)
LPQALELGSNGLNWTFDGLTKTEHRMVLSALAQCADPIGGGSATLDSIDAALRRWGIAFDSTDLGNAQRDLVKWDILIRRDSGVGYAVPMIGAWIKQNRPLEELLQKAVLANPRAQRYYDMALESLRQDKFDEAVSDFGSALNANPAFVEALEGFSSALRLRRKPGDLDLAVEAYERVLGLAPGAPRSTLIELLADAIDGGGDLPTITRYYRRLKELDPEGPYLQRAARFLAAEAHNHESHGYGESLDVAQALYTELGDDSGAERIRREKRRRMVAVIALLTPGLTVLTLATFGGIYPAVFRQETVAAAVYSAAAGAFVSTAYSFTGHKGLQALRSLPAVILVALAAGLTAGLIERFVSWRTTTENWVAGFGIAGFFAHMFLDAKMTRRKPIAPVFKVTKTKPAALGRLIVARGDSDLQRKLIQTALEKLRPGDKVSQAK